LSYMCAQVSERPYLCYRFLPEAAAAEKCDSNPSSSLDVFNTQKLTSFGDVIMTTLVAYMLT
jgi:hypothetical protein